MTPTIITLLILPHYQHHTAWLPLSSLLGCEEVSSHLHLTLSSPSSSSSLPSYYYLHLPNPSLGSIRTTPSVSTASQPVSLHPRISTFTTASLFSYLSHLIPQTSSYSFSFAIIFLQLHSHILSFLVSHFLIFILTVDHIPSSLIFPYFDDKS